MAGKKQWEFTPPSYGFAVVKLHSWRYFFNFIQKEMLDFNTYIWRGQRCDDWLLESTLDRLIKKTAVAKKKRFFFRNAHLEQFKLAVRGRRGKTPPIIETENDWWALGQHYGLATPLLDWTSSPFVAAYFAFIGAGEKQTKYRAVYALQRANIESKVRHLLTWETLEQKRKIEEIESGKKKVVSGFARALLNAPIRKQVEFIRPKSDENQRLVNQGGLFTRAPDELDMKSWVQNSFTEEEENAYILIKILVPNSDREACLKGLNRMNINHLTLFPDLYGASKFCNLYGEIEKY